MSGNRQIKNTKTQTSKKPNILSSTLKLEYIKWFLTLIFSVVTYGIIAKIIIDYYHPNLNQAIETAKQLCINYNPITYLPEPKEKLLYITALIVFSISIFGYYLLTNKITKSIKEKSINLYYYISLLISSISILLITYKGLTAENPFAKNMQNIHDTIAKTNADFYFISTYIYNNFYIYLFIIFPIILLGFLYYDRLKDKTQLTLNKINNLFVYGFCGMLIIILLMIAAFKFPYTYENKYDFNAVFYSVVQVYNGLPLLADGFTNTYGLYPHFIVPILKITSLSILNFSVIMSILVSACFLFLLIFLRKTVENKTLILFGFTSIFFNSYIYSRIITNFDAFYAMTPIRWILIFSLLFYAVNYLRKESRLLYYLSFVIFAAGILWNPEFGTVTFLSLIIVYSFQELKSEKPITVIKNIIKHILTAIIILIITFVFYALSIKIFYGSFPNLMSLFSTMTVFSVLGSGMLPMPDTYHPWMIIALVYIIGLLYSVYNIYKKDISFHSSIILLLTVLGIGCFSYYEGRSHNWNLFTSNPILFILLTIYADDLYKIIKKQKIFILPFAIIIFMLSFSFFQTIYDYKKITELVDENTNKENNYKANKIIEKNANYISKYTKEKEKIVILSPMYLQGYYYVLSKTAAAINPGLEDMFLRTDYNRLLEFLVKNKETKVFFEPGSFNYFDTQIPQILGAYYKAESTNGNLIFFSKKKDLNQKESLLIADDNSTILHKDFMNNPSQQLDYAKGNKGKLELKNIFSVEIIFKPINTPKSTATNWSTLISNVKDSTGFAVQQNDTINNQYIFAIPSEGVICPVIPNQWNYIAFELNNSIIRTFANGQLISIQNVKHNFKNSIENLYISNYNNLAGFNFSEIKEIRISQGLLNDKNISSTWEKVLKELK